jgi:hypothetical protein
MATTEAQVRAYLEPEEPDYQAAASALGAEALPVLERLVRDADPLLASKAAYLASMIPGERAERVLEQAARSDHPTVRVAAAAGIQRRPDVSDDLANALAADPDPGVRKVAAKATRGRAAAAGKRPAAAGGAASGAAGAAGARITEGEHGGGFSPDTTADAEPSAGEGGGEVGGARHPSTRPTASGDEESGGGGDLTGTSGAQPGGHGDGPDGGGLTGGGARDIGISAHGGGQF